VRTKKVVDIGGTEMEFGSKYVYSYTDSEEEIVSEEEFETGMDERTWYIRPTLAYSDGVDHSSCDLGVSLSKEIKSTIC